MRLLPSLLVQSISLALLRSALARILPFVPAAIALSVSGQPTCTTIRDEVDEFTNSHILNITASEYSDGPAFDWLAVDGQVCLRLHWRTAQERPAVVFEGDSLFLKLENDTVLILLSKETVVGKPMHDEMGTYYTDAAYCYRVEEAQLAVLEHYWVQKMRIHFRESRHEFQASGDSAWQMGFWRSANCLRRSLSLEPVPVVRTTIGGPAKPSISTTGPN